MNLRLIHTILILTVSQAGTCLFCRKLFPARFREPLQSLLSVAASVLPALLAPLQTSSTLLMLAAAVAWNASTAALLFRADAVMPSLLGLNLCQLAALAVSALDDRADARTIGFASILLMFVWISLCSLLLGLATAIVRAVRGEQIQSARLLIHVSANLEIAAVGLFVCRTLADKSPVTPSIVLVCILLVFSYAVLLHIHRCITCDSIDLEQRRRLLQTQFQERRNVFAAAEGELARARRMRHDYINHAMVARSLADSGQSAEALCYLANVRRSWESELSGNVELQAFGRTTGMLAARCAESGIVMWLGGEAPDEAGVSSLTALPLLEDVASWAIIRLADAEDASLGLLLHREEAFECILKPAALPSAAEQQELRSLCRGSRIEFRTAGQQLYLRVSGRRSWTVRTHPRMSAGP